MAANTGVLADHAVDTVKDLSDITGLRGPASNIGPDRGHQERCIDAMTRNIAHDDTHMIRGPAADFLKIHVIEKIPAQHTTVDTGAADIEAGNDGRFFGKQILLNFLSNQQTIL